MKRPTILFAALCLSGAALAQNTIYFTQDFEDSKLPTWATHNDSTITTSTQALPHVKFNHILGGSADDALLDTTSDVIANRFLKVSTLSGKNFGRSISYYLGGQTVRGDPAVNKTYFANGIPIRDSHVPDEDEIYLRYRVKLGKTWLFKVNQVVKIPGLAGTYNAGAGRMWPQDPDSLGWSARMLAGRGPGYPDKHWSPISYVYHLDQRCGNTFSNCGSGDHFPSNDKGEVLWAELPRHLRGKWYRIEQRIKMNDPRKSNGLIEVWIDGKKNSALSKDQLRFTTADTIGINRLWADIHYGGRYQSPADNTLFLDDFHVSTGPTPWSGPLGVASEWSGTVVVNGDVTVPAGVTLTVAKGTQVRFLAGTDETGSGTDKTKSELIVAGTLNAGAGGITFRSTNADPDAAEWYGIRVLKGGTANLTNATLQDGVKCVQSAGTLTLSTLTLQKSAFRWFDQAAFFSVSMRCNRSFSTFGFEFSEGQLGLSGTSAGAGCPGSGRSRPADVWRANSRLHFAAQVVGHHRGRHHLVGVQAPGGDQVQGMAWPRRRSLPGRRGRTFVGPS